MNGFWRYARFLRTAVPWSVKVGGRPLLLAAGLSAGSRFVQTVSLFLPIKLLLLVSTAAAPAYLRHLPVHISKTELEIAVGVAIPLLYGAHIFMNFVANGGIAGAVKAAADCGEGPYGEAITKESAKGMVRAMTDTAVDIAVIAMGTLVMLIAAWPVAVANALVSFLLILIVERAVFETSGGAWRDRISNPQFIEYAGAAAYLGVFGLVAAAVAFLGLDIFLAILALLLSRLTMRAVQRLLSNSIRNRANFAKWLEAGAAEGGFVLASPGTKYRDQ